MIIDSAVFDRTISDLVEDYLVWSLMIRVVRSMLINEKGLLKVINMVNANSCSKSRPLKVRVLEIVGYQMANIAYGG